MTTSAFPSTSQPFAARLAETIAWCAPRAQHSAARHGLRSARLGPAELSTDGARNVEEVARKRAQCLEGRPEPVERYEDLRGGRLLVYFPDANLADGAAEVESDGFFDADNVPPWDTWVAFGTDPRSRDISYRSYVIAWVPAELVERANRGIEANPEVCICWLEDAQIGARDELRHLLRQPGGRAT